MNKAIVVANGYICEDAVMQKYGQYQACSFKIAVNTSFKEKPEDESRISNYYNCTYWGSHGENFCTKARKGSFVSVTGEVGLVPYTIKEGETVPILRINVMNAEFLSKPRETVDKVEAIMPV